MTLVFVIITFLAGFYFGFFASSLLVAAGRGKPEKNEEICPIKKLVSASDT